MKTRLIFIAFFALFLLLLWRISAGIRPHRGLHRLLEWTAAGAAVCLLLGLLLKPLGIVMPTGPLPSILTGALGLPGAVVCMLASGL